MKSHLENLLKQNQYLPGIQIETIYRLSWVVMCGTKYARGGFLAGDVAKSRMLPLFGQIKEIWLCHGYIYFEVNLYDTLCYDLNFQAYLVEDVTEEKLFPYESLVDFNVFHLKNDTVGNCYIPTKYCIDDIVEQHIKGSNPLHF